MGILSSFPSHRMFTTLVQSWVCLQDLSYEQYHFLSPGLPFALILEPFYMDHCDQPLASDQIPLFSVIEFG